jgi:uncharacterized glyoxalase superfamily protein PhnB
MDKSLSFYRDMFGAELLFDMEVAGARNVMITIGSSKINFYDKPPKENARGVLHHLGIETDNLEALIDHMKKKGFKQTNEIKNIGTMKYIMAEGPDNVLFEIFEVIKGVLPDKDYKALTSLS